MVKLLRHRQTKGAAQIGFTLDHRATSLLYRELPFIFLVFGL